MQDGLFSKVRRAKQVLNTDSFNPEVWTKHGHVLSFVGGHWREEKGGLRRGGVTAQERSPHGLHKAFAETEREWAGPGRSRLLGSERSEPLALS